MGHDKLHKSEHATGQPDAIAPGDIGAMAVGAAPTSHASSHQDGGADELSVAGLAGELADPQPPKSHAHSSHSGIGTDDHHAKSHAHDGIDGSGQVEGTSIKSTGETGGTKFLHEDGDGTCSWQTPSGGIFGSEQAETSTDAEATNATTTYSDRIDYTTASLTSGRKYRIGFSFQGKTANPGEQGDYIVEVDSTTRADIEVKDNYYSTYGGFYYFTPGSTGTKSIKIRYRVKTGTTGTAYIKNARIEIWRVA
jgi:hypothetical protein